MTSLEITNKIGFCDSGVGGLTVYSKFRDKLDTENCLFFGDLKHSPYGDKTKEQLIGYSRTVFNFFKAQNVKAVIMACNTTSAQTYPTLKNEFDFKIYPIIQSCAKILAGLNVKSLGIFATKATVNSGAYEREINRYNKDMTVYSQSCPGWVEMIENNAQNDPKNKDLVKKDLDKMLANNPDKIVLGCTHYPFLLDVLSEYAPREMFIDPADIFVNYIIDDLNRSGLLNPQKTKGSEEFYVSANPDKFKIASKMFYEVDKVSLV